MMTGPPLQLHIDPEAKPIRIHKASDIPVHLKNKVKADLDRDVSD